MRILLPLLLAASLAGADTIALKDGRFVDGRPFEKTDDGYVIKFEHGEIVVPAEMVISAFRSGEEITFTPTTELEKKKFAKGWVPYRKRWIKVSEYKRRMEEEIEKMKLRMTQMKERRLWRNHATVETRRFIFKHTLPDETFEQFKELFEAYYEYFTKYWRMRPSSKYGKCTINVYHNLEYFEQVSGVSGGVIGYYMPSDRDLHFFYDREDLDFTIDVMFHEGNHMLTHMLNEKLWSPWWISEGLAEYFGASEWDPEAGEMRLGRLQSGRMGVLNAEIEEGNWLKLEQLLRGQRFGATEYAWTWSFCHFLLHSPKYEKGFKRFFVNMVKDRGRFRKEPKMPGIFQLRPDSVIAELKKHLKFDNLEQLQSEWYGYIKDQLSLDRADLDYGQVARTLTWTRQFAKARQYYKKAIDAGSKRAYVHFGYARLKMRQGMPGIAAKYAGKAIEIDPLHARAMSLHGRARFLKGEKEEGLRLMRLAEEIAPDDSKVWEYRELSEQEEREG